MATMTITPWDEQAKTRKYQRAAAYRAPLDTSNRLQSVITYIESQVSQLRHYAGPRGIHFGEWRGKTNEKANLLGNHALLLDYHIQQFEVLQQQAERMGYARFWMTTEDKARRLNSISLVIPFAAPVDSATYERVASCFAKEMDTYGLIDGALTATFVTNIHATTLTAYERGPLLDAEAFKRMTAKMYQRQDASKYYAETRPTGRAAEVHVLSPTITANDTTFGDLFSL